MSTLEAVKEILHNGFISIPNNGNPDIEATELNNNELIIYCGHALDVAETIAYGHDWRGYQNCDKCQRQVLYAYLYAGNYGLQGFMDNVGQNDKAIIKAACPSFYAAAENVNRLETAEFEPLAITGELPDNPSDDNFNNAINMMFAAWAENADAENGELGEAVQDAMSGVYDNLMTEAADPDYTCQLRFTFDNTPDGVSVRVDAGLPLLTEWTDLFTVIIPDNIDEAAIKEILRTATVENGYSWLV